jgi:transcriptional regulator with XRE-family HTH domain
LNKSFTVTHHGCGATLTPRRQRHCYGAFVRRQRLVDARKAAGRSQEEIAELVGVDRTTVGKWERDESTPQPHQRIGYAEALGLTLSELAAVLSSMPIPAGDGTPEWLSTYLGMEQSAVELRAHEPELVYGLLQTPAYTEGVIRKVGLSDVSESYVQEALHQRRHRQQRVHDGSLTLDVIQAEQAVRVRVGDAAVMAEQLTELARVATLPNVTVRITTFDAGQHEARRLDTFVIMYHPWGNPRVWIEGYGGGQFITDADEVSYFVATYEQAARLALSPNDTITFIRELAADWEARR